MQYTVTDPAIRIVGIEQRLKELEREIEQSTADGQPPADQMQERRKLQEELKALEVVHRNWREVTRRNELRMEAHRLNAIADEAAAKADAWRKRYDKAAKGAAAALDDLFELAAEIEETCQISQFAAGSTTPERARGAVLWIRGLARRLTDQGIGQLKIGAAIEFSKLRAIRDTEDILESIPEAFRSHSTQYGNRADSVRITHTKEST